MSSLSTDWSAGFRANPALLRAKVGAFESNDCSIIGERRSAFKRLKITISIPVLSYSNSLNQHLNLVVMTRPSGNIAVGPTPLPFMLGYVRWTVNRMRDHLVAPRHPTPATLNSQAH